MMSHRTMAYFDPKNPTRLREDIDSLKKQFSSLKQESAENWQKVEKNLNEQIEEVKKNLAMMETQLNAKISSLKKDDLAKAQEVDSLKKESNKLKAIAENLSIQHKKEFDDLKHKLSELVKVKAQFEEYKNALDGLKAQYGSDILALKQEISDLREQIKNNTVIEELKLQHERETAAYIKEIKENGQEITMLEKKLEEKDKIIEELKAQSAAMKIEILGKFEEMSQRLEQMTKENKKAKVIKTRFIKKTNKIKKLRQDQQHTLVTFDLLCLAEEALATINSEDIELVLIIPKIKPKLENLRESIRNGIKPGLSEEFLLQKITELVEIYDEFIGDIDMELKKSDKAKDVFLENLQLTPGIFTKDKMENFINSYKNRIDKFEFLKQQWEGFKMKTKKSVKNF